MIRDGIRRAFQLAVRARWERETDEEIATLIAFRAEQLMLAGRSHDDALKEAMAKFGDPIESRRRLMEAARRRDRSADRTESFDNVRQDVTFALRSLRHNRGWTTVTLLTLALGIGAVTAVFSVVSTLLLHPLPYPNAERIAYVSQRTTEKNNTGVNVRISAAPETRSAWKANTKTFENLVSYSLRERTWRTAEGPVTVQTVAVEPSFFAFAAVRALRGRLFTDADVAAGIPVALLGESFWLTRFGGDSAVVGQTLRLGDSTYHVIGILPATAQAPTVGSGPRDIWIPIDHRNSQDGGDLIGRLRPGITAEAAARDLDSIFARLLDNGGKAPPFRAVVTSPSRTVDFRDSLLMLTWAVGLVLLVAFANVAHLVIARSAGRRRELAIRAALGAGARRIFRQLLTESLILSIAGSALGLALGWATLRTLVAMRPATLDELAVARLDRTTLMVTIGVTILGGLAFAVVGALQAARSSTNDALKGSSRAATSGRGRGRSVLVVSEMALSTALIVCAMMVIRSVERLQQADLGFAPKGLYAVIPRVPKDRYATPAARAAVTRELIERVRRIPGLAAAAAAADPPGWWSFNIGALEVEGEPAPPAGTTAFIAANKVETDYFRTMGMRFIAGRIFSDTSVTSSEVIINQAFARERWGDRSPIGKRVRIGGQSEARWLTIVGVIRDAATGGPGSESTGPVFYTPFIVGPSSALLVRASADPTTAVRAIARSIDPQLVPQILDIDHNVSLSIAGPRFVMLLLSVFAALALALAAIGLYGVMAYSVAQRTREIGIRVALGASLSRIAGNVIVGGVALATIGVALGLIAATWGSKVVESQLYGVGRSDVPSFALAVSVLLLAALLACIVPMRRAVSVDPVRAIRSE